MPSPLLLDLFCGAGVGADGYRKAGFDVVGVDTNPKALRHYKAGIPVLDDALTFPLDGADFVHASPPCQAYSKGTTSFRYRGKVYPDLMAATRDRLKAWGGPYVIENVPSAPMTPDIILCGCMFGLEVQRVRWFETNWAPFAFMYPCHHAQPAITVVGHQVRQWQNGKYGPELGVERARAAMGVSRPIPRAYLSQGIPPAYTTYLGGLALEHAWTGQQLTFSVD